MNTLGNAARPRRSTGRRSRRLVMAVLFLTGAFARRWMHEDFADHRSCRVRPRGSGFAGRFVTDSVLVAGTR